jgi:hypothetical protein
MADYTTNDPRGWCGDPSRGAALGRATIKDAPKEYDGKLSLRLVRLDNGGYDRNGTYFGHGQPLYWCASEDGSVDYMLRASCRYNARVAVLCDYPKAKIRK